MIKSLTLAAALHALSPPPAGDSVLGSTFVGPVINSYSGAAMQGFSWFTIDKHGRYTGHTIARKPGDDCLSYDPQGWTGQLYRLSRQTYFAFNDEAHEGYLIQLAPDRRSGSSTYFGAEVGVIEANWFYKDRHFQPDKILSLAAGGLCDPAR
jgi:hypothetical protein